MRKWVNPSGTATYYSWRSMRSRCTNPKNTQYEYYGARGITICPQWLNNYDQFFEDMGPVPDGLTLERINNDGNYEPGNCRWATYKDQLNNRRMNRHITLDGETRTLGQWATHLGVRYGTLRERLLDMPPEKALKAGPLRVMQHGGLKMYVRGCRCQVCKDANNERGRRQRAKVKVAREQMNVK